MATTLDVYYELGVYTKNGTVDLTSSDIKLALLTDAYTPDLDTHTVWGDVSAAEVAAGDGYTAGGAQLPNRAVTRTVSITKWTGDNVTFAGLTKTFKYGILYVDATVNGVIKPLIAVIDFDDSGTDAVITVTDAAYTVQWHADGIWESGPTADICT